MSAPTLRRMILPLAPTVLLTLLVLACDQGPPGAPHCSGVSGALVVPRPPTIDLDSPEVSSENLRAWVDRLAAPDLRGRHALSDEARVTAAMIARHMAILGLEAPFPRENYCQAFPSLDATYNVVGHLGARRGEAAPASSSRPAIVLGAHYDGQGQHAVGLFPGADDNASGVAALLELARLAARRSWPFDLVFAAFTAEEIGLIGSKAWVAEPTVPLTRLHAMMNFDMVGRPWPGSPAEAIGYEAWDIKLGMQGETSIPAISPSMVEGLSAASEASGVEVRRLKEFFADKKIQSDSTPFRRHVPVIFLSTGLHEDHHERSDTVDRIDPDQIVRVVRLAFAYLERSADHSASKP